MRLNENIPLDTHLIADLVTDRADLHLVWPLARHPFDHDQWREALDPECGHFSFGVYVGAALIGHAALRKTERHGVYSVSFLYLTPESRSRGLGRRMVALLEEYARTRLAATELILVARDYNPGALNCYMRCGFKETGREGTLIRMSKALTPDAQTSVQD